MNDTTPSVNSRVTVMVAIQSHHSRCSSLRKAGLPVRTTLSVRSSFTPRCLKYAHSRGVQGSCYCGDLSPTYNSNLEANHRRSQGAESRAETCRHSRTCGPKRNP